jgi:hypothetical protein
MALRQLTDRDRLLIGKFAAQHGQVRRSDRQIADDSGGIGVPFERLSTLRLLEARGVITAAEAQAGARFNALFQHAHLDALKAADMSREPVAGGLRDRDLSHSGERCRRQIADAMAVLGGNSAAASIAWHCLGLEWSTRRWAISTQRTQDRACGILIGALAALAAHFNGGRRAINR